MLDQRCALPQNSGASGEDVGVLPHVNTWISLTLTPNDEFCTPRNVDEMGVRVVLRTIDILDSMHATDHRGDIASGATRSPAGQQRGGRFELVGTSKIELQSV
ncbi:hypothetical protein ASF91_13335 [Rhizobium sp. Leaf155]|nr:hypothetical protein ASF91_13335 [Rhizobium sp. Leaf155]